MAEITKIWIADKMREIMKHKPIDKIRVTEICKAAEIGRPTFYYHFKDKYDLVAWMFCTDAYGTDPTEIAKEKLGTDILDTQLAYSIRFYCMGSVGMTQEWVLNDNITSAETVVQMMFNSMPQNLRTILF